VRQAYGFRDHEFFKLKILAIHETRYAFVGGAEKMRVM
jgi:transposase